MSTVVVIAVLVRGLSTTPENQTTPYHDFKTLHADAGLQISEAGYRVVAGLDSTFGKAGFVKLAHNGEESIWQLQQTTSGFTLEETLYVTKMADGTKLFNGAPAEAGKFFPVGHIKELKINGESVTATGAVGPLAYLSALRDSTIVLWGKKYIQDGNKLLTVYYQKPTPGSRVLRPGLKFKVDNATGLQKFNFMSLMLALFCGTAALPHILIRYYTVPSQSAARKSTIVAIAAIGFFYILTLFLGMGAMTNGVINITDNNMSAPLLALSFGVVLFAVISSLAFATVLGTVSGLIVAASGAIAHDLMDNFLGMKMTDPCQSQSRKNIGDYYWRLSLFIWGLSLRV